MKKATKEKCKYYDSNNNACNLLSSGLCKCLDNCWYIKTKVNTEKKRQVVEELRQKMELYK